MSRAETRTPRSRSVTSTSPRLTLRPGSGRPQDERAEPEHDAVGDRTADRPAEPASADRRGAHLELDEQLGRDLLQRAGRHSEGRELEVEEQVERLGVREPES